MYPSTIISIFPISNLFPLFGHNYTIARVFQAILSALTCVILYYIAKNIFDKKVAKVSAWILALYPVLIVYTGLILTETLFTFLIAIFVLFLIKGINTTNTRYFLISGFFLGLATLTRPVTLLLPFVILLLFLIIKRKLLLSWCMLFFIFSIVLSPWLIRNYILFKTTKICSTGLGFGLFVTGNMAKGSTFSEGYKKYSEMAKQYPEPTIFIKGQSPSLELEKRLEKEGLSLIKENFKNYILIVIKRLPRFWWTSHSAVFGVNEPIPEYLKQKNYLHLSVRLGLLWLHLMFLILALIGMWISRRQWKITLILILILVYFSGHVAFDPVPRYHLPVIPYVFIFISYALINIPKWKKRI